MHFLILSKKEHFYKDYINEDVLNSVDATSLISNSVIKYELGKFIIFIYNYNHVYEEKENYSYYFDENQVFLINGVLTIDEKARDPDIRVFFEKLNENSEIIGDYQIFSLNKNGDGFCKTPLSSVKKLFFYEDDFCSVISSEIKLIVDGISKFSKSKFVNNFDSTYMYDTFHSGAFLKYPRHTIFKDIKRIFPHDELLIKNFNFLVVKNDTITPPEWFINLYEQDKDKLYDWYYDKLLKYTEQLLSQYKNDISHISLGLTGGFDSRVSAVILDKVCSNLGIKFKTFTSGQKDHPDVIIAKMIAECLNLDWNYREPVSKEHPSCQNIGDYSQSFFVTQGDFDSRDYIKYYKRNLVNSKGISQKGMDAYKRGPMTKICSGNIWFSRVILFMNNFFLPLFFTDYELWFGRLFYDILGNIKIYKEYVYNILKRANPKLLDIPFAGDYLPQVDVKGIDQGNALATVHTRQPFYWDYNFVLKNLKPCLAENFNYLSEKQLNILKKANINELDFVLIKDIKLDLEKFRKEIEFDDSKVINDLIIKFKSLKENSLYPQGKSFVEFKKDKNYGYVTRLTQWMDYACSANVNSFIELEKNASFTMELDKIKFKDDYEIIKKSGMFDEEWYLNNYSLNDTQDAILHYLRLGVKKGFNPSKDFDTNWYLLKNGDVKRAGINPFVHYIKYGQFEVRVPKLCSLNQLLNSSNKVIKGLNNYLFELSEINQHFNVDYISQFSLKKFQNEFKSFSIEFKNENIDFYDVVIPDKSIVCKSKLPFTFNKCTRNIDSIENIIDFSNELNINHYFTHDSHLNVEGYKLFASKILSIIDDDFIDNNINELISKNMIKKNMEYKFDLLEEQYWDSIESIKRVKISDTIEYEKNEKCIDITDQILDTFKSLYDCSCEMYLSENSFSNSKILIFHEGNTDFMKEYFSLYFNKLFFSHSLELNRSLINWFKPDVVIRIFDENILEILYSDNSK